MRNTRKLVKEDALEVIRALNTKFDHLQITKEEWPAVVLEDWGYLGWESSRICYVKITFEIQPGFKLVGASIDGYVEIGSKAYKFSKLTLSQLARDRDVEKLSASLTILLYDVLTRRLKKVPSEASIIRDLLSDSYVV